VAGTGRAGDRGANDDPLTSLIEEMAESGPSSILDLAERVNTDEKRFSLPVEEAPMRAPAPAAPGAQTSGEAPAGPDMGNEGFASVLARIVRDSGLGGAGWDDEGDELVDGPTTYLGPAERGPGAPVHHADAILAELADDDGPQSVAPEDGDPDGPRPEPTSAYAPLATTGIYDQEADERWADGATDNPWGVSHQADRVEEQPGPGATATGTGASEPTSWGTGPVEDAQWGAAHAAGTNALALSSQVSNFGLALHELGLPLPACREVRPAATRESLESELARTLRSCLRTPPDPPRSPSSVVAVVGPKGQVMAAAQALAEEMGAAQDIALATRRKVWRQQDQVIASAEVALEQRRSWRWRSQPSVVAIEHDVHPGGAAWATQMLRALEPTLCWGVASAGHKPEDLAAWSDALGGLDAIALVDLDGTTTPAAALSAAVPVGSLDGEPATPEAWARVLCDRLLGSVP
jgi:hypothetical protein